MEWAQVHALCTYKDPDLPTAAKLDRALDLLDKADNLACTTDQETLGQAGAIFKNKWEAGGNLQHLERSLAYSMRRDADYLNYYQRSFNLLAPNGVILVDNVLWSGDVLKQLQPDESTAAIQELNRTVSTDPA